MIAPFPIILGFSTLFGAIIFYRLNLWWTRRRWCQRMKQGARGEVIGERLLRKQGYRIESTQHSVAAKMLVDGREKSYQLRPDAIVRKKRTVYAAEMKTGEKAGDPLFTETRRQLLEYYHTAPVDGVLLVNADTGRIHEISFPSRIHSKRFPWLAVVVAFLMGVAATVAAGSAWMNT